MCVNEVFFNKMIWILILMLFFLIELNWVEYFGYFYFYGEEKFIWEDVKVFFGLFINV